MKTAILTRIKGCGAEQTLSVCSDLLQYELAVDDTILIVSDPEVSFPKGGWLSVIGKSLLQNPKQIIYIPCMFPGKKIWGGKPRKVSESAFTIDPVANKSEATCLYYGAYATTVAWEKECRLDFLKGHEEARMIATGLISASKGGTFSCCRHVEVSCSKKPPTASREPSEEELRDRMAVCISLLGIIGREMFSSAGRSTKAKAAVEMLSGLISEVGMVAASGISKITEECFLRMTNV